VPERALDRSMFDKRKIAISSSEVLQCVLAPPLGAFAERGDCCHHASSSDRLKEIRPQ
jgi:hypothetical protein